VSNVAAAIDANEDGESIEVAAYSLLVIENACQYVVVFTLLASHSKPGEDGPEFYLIDIIKAVVSSHR
jgi:hypothetical protein